MARQLPSTKFGSLTGGINRFVADAKPNQVVDGMNIYERDGDLARRPAFIPIAHGAPYLLPAGMVYVIKQEFPSTYTNYPNRNPIFSSEEFGGLNGRLWVGCRIPFDGVAWGDLTDQPSDDEAENNARVFPKYRQTDGGLEPIYGSVDTTLRRVDQSTSVSYYQSLRKSGFIGWNKTGFVDWTATTLNSITGYYWVALDISIALLIAGETAPAVVVMPTADPGLTFEISAPGIRCFLLNPVNGLHSLHTKNNARCMVIGSDFAAKRGNVLGGGLGYVRGIQDPTEIARIIIDEGGGASGQVAATSWGTTRAAGTWNDGTAGAITKHRRDYDWTASGSLVNGQFDGAAILAVDPTGASSNTIPVASGWNGTHPRNFENHRARIAVQPGPGGPPVGEVREVWRSDASATLIEIYDNWSAALNGNETIEIRRPPHFVRTLERGADYELSSHTEDALTLVSGRPYVRAVAGADLNRYVNFEVYRDSYWSLKPGLRWRVAYDSVTGRLIMTNGSNGLLEYDGRRTRRLEALWDSTEGRPGAATIELWRGQLQDLVTRNNDPNLLAGSQLRHSPPNGKFVVDFSGRLVVANIREREQSVMWTAPGALNNIWPFVYESLIRDSQNNPITGMRTLGEMLVVFTKTAIFTGTQPNDRGEIFFRPASQGVGFVSHDAVAPITVGSSNVLIGPAADGIYLFDGSEPRVLLDDWRRVLENGTNKNMLEFAVGAAWQAENLYFLAVPSSGSAELDRLIVVDYSGAPDVKIWVWEAPVVAISGDGVVTYDAFTAIAQDFDDNGNERVIFGHKSGHVTALYEAGRDGWNGEIIGRFRTKPIGADGQVVAFSKLLVTMRALGTDKEVTFRGRVDRHDRPVLDFSRELPSVATDALYGTSEYNDADALYASAPYRTYPINVPLGARGEQFDIEVESSAEWVYQDAAVLFTPKGQRSQ